MSQGDLFDAAPPAGYARIHFISAGAGSGKTYRLTEELERALVEGGVDASRVVATTFTVKAASELNDRVRQRLVRSGRIDLAERMNESLIGTVHSVCERLLKRFSFELALSPALEVVALEDAGRLFEQSLDRVMSLSRLRAMNVLAERLEIEPWEGQVKKVADAARANDIDAATLRAMGRKNADDLLAYFPVATKDDLDRGFFAAVKAAADGIVPVSKLSRKYLERINATVYALRRHRCSWGRWVSLARAKAGVRDGGEPFAVAVRVAAVRYAEHPGLRRDLRAYLEEVFAIAADALLEFQRSKRERCLIDFTDMEALMLRALDVPVVVERLRDEVEFLLVDEFQDTSPMQLALFMKLADLARKVIFVGDVKQAIYGFRGSDPDLVFATLTGLAEHGARIDILSSSYRSRPGLVRYINALFVPAFARDAMPAHHVELTAARAELTGASVLGCWRVPGSAAAQHVALAQAVAALVAESYPVVDRDTELVRPLRYGDVAVLAATNEHVEEIARALRDARVPFKMTISGLLATPEVTLARSCLRRLDDSADTLATAEIMTLATCTDPEVWLADRLRWLASGEPSYRWGETSHPIIAKLARLRAEMATESPLEIVARVLNYVDIRGHVTAWGPDAVKAAQRQRNLDAFLDLAVQYERHCASAHEPATLTGFLFWIEHPVSPELDLQPVVTAGDAVHVLTYHRAKGLEWPVVIATDMAYEWKSRLWDVQVESLEGPLDLAAPLARRFIRFWPYPFGDRASGIPVVDAIEHSEHGMHSERSRLSEARRIAYVGLTRARDLLVFALPTRDPGPSAWLHAFEGEALLPRVPVLELPEGDTLACDIRFPGVGSAVSRPPFRPRWFVAREPLVAPLIESVSPSAAGPRKQARILRIVELGPRIEIGPVEVGSLGRALHRVIAAELLNSRNDAEQARGLLAAQGVGEAVSAEDALAVARRLVGFVRSLSPRSVHVEYPVAHALSEGQWSRGWIDLLVETEAGLVVIDHKSSPQPRSKWAGEVTEYAGQLAAYAAALEAARRRVASTWIHFAVGGAMAQIDLG